MTPIPLRTAVIGAGHFGRFHADKYASLPGSRLIGVVDSDRSKAEEVASRLDVPAFTDHRQLFGQVDAVSIAVPTNAHFEVARDCIGHGIHVLIEKPIAESIEQADELIRLAAARNVVLQVGHLQRFLLERLGVIGMASAPLYIECSRIAPFKPRGTDVGVTLDLMIHDIDLVLACTKSPIVSVDAVGAPVVSREEDIANTRLRFASGCVATLTASRVSLKTERKMRIFQRDAYISIDLHARRLSVIRKGNGVAWLPGLPPISQEEHEFGEGDDLKAEIAGFLDSVATGRPPLVTGEDGRRALETAMRISQSLKEHLAFVDNAAPG